MDRVSKAERELVRKMQRRTNADRIRSMTDEKLADELLEWYAVFSAVEWTKDMILDWLRKEAADKDGEA